MKVKKFLDKILKESIEPLSNGKTGIIVCDLDDTLLVAQDIKIYKFLNGEKDAIKLSPEEFAKDLDKKNKTPGVRFSYEEFRNPEKVRNSIETGIPIIKNLKIMDSYLNAGYKFALLTARGLEDVVAKSLDKFLMFRNPDKELIPIKEKLKRELIFAINDETKVYEGGSDPEKKALILKKLSKEYDYVKFLDDDNSNLSAVRSMKDPKIKAIQAWGKHE